MHAGLLDLPDLHEAVPAAPGECRTAAQHSTAAAAALGPAWGPHNAGAAVYATHGVGSTASIQLPAGTLDSARRLESSTALCLSVVLCRACKPPVVPAHVTPHPSVPGWGLHATHAGCAAGSPDCGYAGSSPLPQAVAPPSCAPPVYCSCWLWDTAHAECTC